MTVDSTFTATGWKCWFMTLGRNGGPEPGDITVVVRQPAGASPPPAQPAPHTVRTALGGPNCAGVE